MKDVLQKVLDSGLIQKIEQIDDNLLLLSFAFEANDLGFMFYYNSYRNEFFDDDLYPEIRYFGSLLVDYEGNVIKGIVDSILFGNRDKSERKTIYNKSQMINKSDKIKLSRMFSVKDGFILPYCLTNSTLTWKNCIKSKYNKLIKDWSTSKLYGFSTIWRYIGRDEFITHDLLERKCHMENFLLELENKVKCAQIIGKSIISSGEIVAESNKQLGKDIIKSNKELSGTIAYKEMQPIVNIRH